MVLIYHCVDKIIVVNSCVFNRIGTSEAKVTSNSSVRLNVQKHSCSVAYVFILLSLYVYIFCCKSVASMFEFCAAVHRLHPHNNNAKKSRHSRKNDR